MANNVQQGLRLYCGLKDVPEDSRRGNVLECFRRGFAVGKRVQEQKERVKRRTDVRRAEAITSVLEKRKLVDQIQTNGLNVLKRQLSLDTLNKDLVRSLATRLTGTEQAIRNYSSMTREQLVNALVERGFQR